MDPERRLILRPTKEQQSAIVIDWPIYISNSDEITCYKDGCIEPNFIPWPRRKKTWGLITIDLIKHIDEIHGWDIP